MRKLSKERYMVTGFITILLFSLGFFLGSFLNEKKIEDIEKIAKEQESDLNSLQFQFSYLQSLPANESCVVLSRILESNLKILGAVIQRIEAYEQSGDANNEDYIIVKRKYIVANLRYWLLADQSKKLCGTDVVNVLYFHSKNCDRCGDEGYILDQMKKMFGDRLLVFPIDATIAEPMIDVLRAQYKIYSFPNLVIEGKTIDKFLTMEEMFREICPLYKNDYTECEGYR
ncbi:MAG: hypothetical protein V1900_01495 [Candidatus Aenigmatarchaeota archaeon]